MSSLPSTWMSARRSSKLRAARASVRPVAGSVAQGEQRVQHGAPLVDAVAALLLRGNMVAGRALHGAVRMLRQQVQALPGLPTRQCQPWSRRLGHTIQARASLPWHVSPPLLSKRARTGPTSPSARSRERTWSSCCPETALLRGTSRIAGLDRRRKAVRAPRLNSSSSSHSTGSRRQRG